MILHDKRLHFQYNPEKNMDKRFIGFTTAIGVALGAAAGTATATAIGVGVTGLAAYGAYKGFQGMTAKPQTPQIQGANAAEPSYDRASELAQKDIDKKRRGIARNSTQYTSPMGLTPTSQSNLNLKTLTGV